MDAVFAARAALLVLTLGLSGLDRAAAQGVVDGSDSALEPGRAAAALALLGRDLRDASAARVGRLRAGRGRLVCGEVDRPNRMGDYTGPRPFVADPEAGFAGIVPDAPELRHPASAAQYQAMQRTLTLHAAHCAAE